VGRERRRGGGEEEAADTGKGREREGISEVFLFLPRSWDPHTGTRWGPGLEVIVELLSRWTRTRSYLPEKPFFFHWADMVE
jgi:hypothetical protein